MAGIVIDWHSHTPQSLFNLLIIYCISLVAELCDFLLKFQFVCNRMLCKCFQFNAVNNLRAFFFRKKRKKCFSKSCTVYRFSGSNTRICGNGTFTVFFRNINNLIAGKNSKETGFFHCLHKFLEIWRTDLVQIDSGCGNCTKAHQSASKIISFLFIC